MFLVPIIPWATEANYPSGSFPWSSQPTKVAPVGDIFTPDTKPPAQYFNYLFNQYSGTLFALQEYALSGTLINWSFEFEFLAANTKMNINWDPFNRLFMLVSNNNNVTVLSVTYGLDEATSGTWIDIGTSFNMTNPAVYAACCVDPTTVGQYWVTATDDIGVNNNLVGFWWDGSSWTQKLNISAPGTFYGVEAAFLNGYVIFAAAGTSSNPRLVSSNNQFTTISDVVTDPAMAVGSTWCMKSNGVQVVAIPSSQDFYKVYSTVDGTSWTVSLSLTTFIASGNTVVGLAWTQDAAGLCWVACVQSASGQPFWVRSADGVTWTLQTGGISTNLVVVDMAAVGSHLKCTLQDLTTGGPSGVIYSVDGGITWYWDQAVLTTNTVLGNNRSRVFNSYNGFMIQNGIWGRFSGLAGLPTFHL